ncbi:curli production assembly/transport protein CsgG [Moraxellaceae bacterium AER2_44_116]|nr:curli production assembly/transport protein CsgG [Moraxellaceae bacterium]TQC95724.1 curli production assembly/transport protein CsgG [Moraxellaceae bacterium AER2_44_116]
MYHHRSLFLSLLTVLSVSACSTFNSQPMSTLGTAELTPMTNLTSDMLNLPAPRGKVVAAVYGFKDQTGQYKSSPDSNFSTAVTQGGSAILLKALRDSKWFIPVERENLQNILTERKIVRAIEQPNESENKNPIKLPSLMGAKLLIEGAVIGYDSNIKTGGVGVKYLGVGSAGQYRADQVTVNLRAIDINSGQILHSVSTTKTVYSTQLTSGVYKFISYKSLLEAEVGTTLNEPVQIAVQEAIEAAVVNLIAEGIDSRSWLLANDADLHAPVLERYRQQRLRHTEPMANKPQQLASNGFSEEAPFDKQKTIVKNGAPALKPAVVKKKKSQPVAPVESSQPFGFE